MTRLTSQRKRPQQEQVHTGCTKWACRRHCCHHPAAAPAACTLVRAVAVAGTQRSHRRILGSDLLVAVRLHANGEEQQNGAPSVLILQRPECSTLPGDQLAVIEPAPAPPRIFADDWRWRGRVSRFLWRAWRHVSHDGAGVPIPLVSLVKRHSFTTGHGGSHWLCPKDSSQQKKRKAAQLEATSAVPADSNGDANEGKDTRYKTCEASSFGLRSCKKPCEGRKRRGTEPVPTATHNTPLCGHPPNQSLIPDSSSNPKVPRLHLPARTLAEFKRAAKPLGGRKNRTKNNKSRKLAKEASAEAQPAPAGVDGTDSIAGLPQPLFHVHALSLESTNSADRACLVADIEATPARINCDFAPAGLSLSAICLNAVSLATSISVSGLDISRQSTASERKQSLAHPARFVLRADLDIGQADWTGGAVDCLGILSWQDVNGNDRSMILGSCSSALVEPWRLIPRGHIILLLFRLLLRVTMTLSREVPPSLCAYLRLVHAAPGASAPVPAPYCPARSCKPSFDGNVRHALCHQISRVRRDYSVRTGHASWGQPGRGWWGFLSSCSMQQW